MGAIPRGVAPGLSPTAPSAPEELSMAPTREKFATLVNSEILSEVRLLAEREGRQLHALVDEALADLIEKRKNGKPRPHVIGTFHATLEKYSSVYKKLAE
jgi:hypothetical protein